MGALNVGSIVLDFDEDVATNQAYPQSPYYEDKIYTQEVDGPLSRYLSAPDEETGKVSFEKGEMTGRFEMGSTIVLIYEAPTDSQTLVEAGDKVTLGEPLVLTEPLVEDGTMAQQ